MEADIIAKGIEPEPAKWPKHVKNWFFGHGGRLDLETSSSVWAKTQNSSTLIGFCYTS
jgi:hypothetical protein